MLDIYIYIERSKREQKKIATYQLNHILLVRKSEENFCALTVLEHILQEHVYRESMYK